MRRRDLLFGLAATALVASPTTAQEVVPPRPRSKPRVFLNGTLNADGSLDWSNGGGDPLHKKFVDDGFLLGLKIERLNIDRRTQILIRNAVRLNPDGHEVINLDEMYRGKTLPGAMISGNGWISIKPVVRTDKWSREEFRARIWYVTVPQEDGTSHRWQVIDPLVCRNLTLIPLDVPLACVCDPERDAYPRS